MRIKALKQSSKFRFSSIFCDAHCEPHAARHHRSFWRAPQLIQCNLSPKFQQPSIGWMIRTRITLQALPRSPYSAGALLAAPQLAMMSARSRPEFSHPPLGTPLCGLAVRATIFRRTSALANLARLILCTRRLPRQRRRVSPVKDSVFLRFFSAVPRCPRC